MKILMEEDVQLQVGVKTDLVRDLRLAICYYFVKLGSRGEYQVIMKEIWMDIIGHETCQDQLRETRLGKYFELDRTSFICAGGESDKDMCTVSQFRL